MLNYQLKIQHFFKYLKASQAVQHEAFKCKIRQGLLKCRPLSLAKF